MQSQNTLVATTTKLQIVSWSVQKLNLPSSVTKPIFSEIMFTIVMSSLSQ